MNSCRMYILFIGVLLLQLSSTFEECNFDFTPIPQVCIVATNPSPIKVNPCNIVYYVSKQPDDKSAYEQLITQNQKVNFGCSSPNIIYNHSDSIIDPMYLITIRLEDYTVKSVFTLEEESYKLNVSLSGAYLYAPTYVGFVHGLQTFLQTINCTKDRYSNQCAFTHLPIYVEDQPQFPYRGLLIDSARHFVPLHLIFQTIDALRYSKMNVLHWHITDEDSFPLKLESHPEMAEYGAFSPEETYTVEDAKQVVRYAMVRGVRVIPEIDSPGHAYSWSLAPENKQLACTLLVSKYRGPLDITLSRVYEVVRQIYTEIDQIFIDPYIHLGGDEVELTCLVNISSFQGMTNDQLQIFYQNQARRILHQINPNKTPIFWQKGAQPKHYVPTDIVQWWGDTLPPVSNRVIISYHGPYYLNRGVGNYLGTQYGVYSGWRDLYNQNIQTQIINYPNKDKVLGGVVTLWTEMSSFHTHHVRLWPRASAVAERLWNSKVTNVPAVLKRLVAHQKLLKRRGLPTHPITTRFCQENPVLCV